MPVRRGVIHLVAGARPNFVKLAPVHRALRELVGGRLRVVHTGQHYDDAMSEVFFSQLGIPAPDVNLDVGSGSHGAQTARILERYERLLHEERPAAVVVFGDVNSTVACALAGVKLGVPIVHVEAGLRSFDRSMPEEINRVLTDAIAELLLVSEPSGVENLRREGIPDDRVQLVGNTMIDTLVSQQAAAQDRQMAASLGLDARAYALLTLHRPSNVDAPGTLKELVGVFARLAARVPIVFPVHPRTQAALRRSGAEAEVARAEGLRRLDPLPYVDTLSLLEDARVVLTDSGGIQEEAAYLGVPCITLRENTERPVTIDVGANRLVGSDPARIAAAFDDAVGGAWPRIEPVALWDGHAGERAARLIRDLVTQGVG